MPVTVFEFLGDAIRLLDHLKQDLYFCVVSTPYLQHEVCLNVPYARPTQSAARRPCAAQKQPLSGPGRDWYRDAVLNGTRQI